jgi:hypothetical protein
VERVLRLSLFLPSLVLLLVLALELSRWLEEVLMTSGIAGDVTFDVYNLGLSGLYLAEGI